MIKRILLRGVPVLLLGVLPAFAAGAADLKSLVAAERAFSRLAETRGIREAFLSNLADESIVFRPRPVPGKKTYTERETIPGLLTWRPEFADISAAGDLGYTTGPYEVRKERPEEIPAAFGHYVSLLCVQKDGSWKVVVDCGVSHPREEPPAPDFMADERIPPPSIAPPADEEKERAALLALERSLSETSRKSGFLAVYRDNLAADARLYRASLPPIVGKAAGIELLAKTKGVLTWEPMAAHVSVSGDMGYAYGTAKLASFIQGREDATNFSYLRIWKRDASGMKRIVLDLATEIPPPAKSGK